MGESVGQEPLSEDLFATRPYFICHASLGTNRQVGGLYREYGEASFRFGKAEGYTAGRLMDQH